MRDEVSMAASRTEKRNMIQIHEDIVEIRVEYGDFFFKNLSVLVANPGGPKHMS